MRVIYLFRLVVNRLICSACTSRSPYQLQPPASNLTGEERNTTDQGSHAGTFTSFEHDIRGIHYVVWHLKFPEMMIVI